MGEISILVEGKEGKVEKPTLELIYVAKKLGAEFGFNTSCIAIGHSINNLTEECSLYGLDKVYKLENEIFKDFVPDIWLLALENLHQMNNFDIILMTHSPISRDIAPRLAYRLNSTALTDCVDIKRDGNSLVLTKPIYGGNATAIIKVENRPSIVTLRKNSFAMAEKVSQRSEVQEIQIDIDRTKVRTEIVGVKEREMVEMDKAEIIVAGGRGISSLDDFKMLEDLVNVIKKRGINAMVGCSRPVVDKGWMTSDRQIGLTGTMVAPNLYIAIGISGAIQHLVGMVRSKKIIAINTDPGCNMFKVADYGIAEDYKEVLPFLIKKLEG